jgi:hypothetical protein
MTVVLESPLAHAEIRPELGARVQHLVDRTSGRELLYQREASGAPEAGFLQSSTGGWDEMFPNDEPWNGHPDHGRVWSTPFQVLEQGEESCYLAAEIEEPAVHVERRYRLLRPPRRGLRSELAVTARRHTGPFLWAAHPMLAVARGWRVEGLDEVPLEVDDILSGRLDTGVLPAAARSLALTMPGAGVGLIEVLYAFGVGSVEVAAPDGRARTRVEWDEGFLPWLWVCTVSGEVGIDLCVVLEPCTSAPYRVPDAIRAGTTAELWAGARAEWWVEIEGLGLDAGTAPAAEII